MIPDNKTITYFFLIGFQSNNSINILLFIIFLMTYLVTLTGDLVISILVTKSHRLQYPMFYFLKHLSISELLFTTNITPNMLYIILKGGGFMSLAGCIIQLYIYTFFGTMESLILSLMSYDRYLAICNPLRYANMMNLQFCRRLVLSTWILSSISSLITIILFCQLKICGSNVIDHYFCDFAPLMDRACSDTSIVRVAAVGVSTLIVIPIFSLIIWTYVRIFITILRISSSVGRQKAFSTCSSHLASVCSFYGPLIIIYLVPYRKDSLNVNKFVSILYTVVTPLFNPLIYSFRNEEIRCILWKLMKK
ncbi:olfactory receptor 5p57-like [Anomaloglossus baeobatrachus]|uniref:olfactory receptor 5p57-like n=1 Tax=Anomaloglossus baeobatrachus TaxID=238106 RepID=UPI003F4FC401